MEKLASKWLGIGLLLCAPIVSHAVTLDGTDVSFTFDDSTLFGTANVVGNSIFFQPTNFKAESLNGAGVVTASETLNITVTSLTSGYVIENVVLQELGDYQLSGANAEVTASGRLQVTSLTTVDPGTSVPFVDAQVFNVGGLTTQGSLTNWSGGTSVDLTSISGWGSDINLSAQIQNNLSATTLANGESAMIQKKFSGVGGVGLIVNPNPIPLPAAVWMFGAGLLAMLGVARRRRT